MRPTATRPRDLPTLYLAFELGNTEWKLAMTTSVDQAPLVRTIPARGLTTLETEIARAKVHFRLPAGAPVRSCYEAGRDGFWLHRYLVSRGIANSIVDSSSIEVNRRRRRTKTDRLDACKLVTMLIRAAGGEKKVWSVVNVPTLLGIWLIVVNRLVSGAFSRGLRWFGTVVGVGLMIAAVFPVGNFLFVDPTFGPLPFSSEPPAGTEQANEILHNILAIGGFLGVAPLPIWTALVGRKLLKMGRLATVGVTTEGAV